MHIVGFLLLVIGSIIGFWGKETYKFVMKITPNEMDIIKTKTIGLITAFAGTVIIMIFLR